MDRIEGVANPLRVTNSDITAQDRTQQLARNLDERLSKRIEDIRAKALSHAESDKRSPSPPGTGLRLDVLA